MQLDGVTVVDLTRLLPGPYATQLLADAGADVLKVEDTKSGDYARETPPLSERGVGAVFDMVNRGKRSVSLDLKADAGRDVFYELVGEADVLIEQFRPGVVDRLGIDYETVSEYNDDIIYCSLSGYGQTGPYADRAGHDLNYVGLAGLVDMTRADDGSPAVPGYPIGDLGGGLYAATAITGALASRALGNTAGEYIDVAMADVVLSFSQTVAHEALTGDDPRPDETTLTGAYPCYDVYECADGEYITFAALEPKFWETFCAEVGRDDLVDRHMEAEPEDRASVRAELESIFARRPLAEWMDELSDETMTAPVNTPAEAVEHPQFEARDLVERPDGAPPRIGFPAAEELDSEDVPDQGEHTDAVLSEIGLSEGAISDLRDRNVIY